jgi:acyl-CoA thioester hydrolase
MWGTPVPDVVSDRQYSTAFDGRLCSVAARPVAERCVIGLYPLRFQAQIRFADLDVLAHVNNLAMGAFHEDGRATLTRRAFATAGELGQPNFMAAQTSTHFLAQAFWPGELTVCAGVDRIGRTSYVVCTATFSGQVCVSLCDTVLVLVGEDGPETLSADVRQRLVRFGLGAAPETAGDA